MSDDGEPTPVASASVLAFVVESNPDPDDLAFLEARVLEATRVASGTDDDRELAVFVRDRRGRVVAGISGVTWGGCCELQLLWVDHTLSGRGIGGKLLAEAEAEARRRACTQVALFTHDVQVPGYYERFGYETVGVLEGYPAGSRARWFRKSLQEFTPDG